MCRCGKTSEVYRLIAERDQGPECCDEAMERKIVPTHVAPDIEPYQSMADGTMIMSRSQHREHLKRHGLVEVGNEVKYLTRNAGPVKPPPGLKETLIRVANEKLRWK